MNSSSSKADESNRYGEWTELPSPSEDHEQSLDDKPSSASFVSKPQFPEEAKTTNNKPEFPEEALYGPLGDITRFVAPETEADPVAIYIQLLAAVGNYVGRTPFFIAGKTRHYANLFAVLVGPTSIGRKGTALDYVKELMKIVDPFYCEQIESGLATGEGLIWKVRDPIYQLQYDKKSKQSEKVLIDEGVKDKRLLLTEAEFVRPLRAMARPTNILSGVLRDAWDGLDLRTMTKGSPARATGPHITIITHITQFELERELGECEFFNGFGNRFLWSIVERAQILPDGGNLNEELFKQHADELGSVLSQASKIEQMQRDDEAKALWHRAYGDLTEGRSGLFGAITGRGAPQVLRISMILALSDGSSLIAAAHLRAALALWKYCFESARCLFGSRLSDPKADQILAALRLRPDGMTRQQISEEIFKRHVSADRISTALRLLKEFKLAYCKIEPTAGRNVERWFATV